MKIYYAPLEGITGYIYRNAHNSCFNHIDKYFSPFISATPNEFKNRDHNDVHPENNKGLSLVPQLLTNNAKDFILAERKLMEMGYQEVNFNLGCPSGTVVAKSKGSGFLAKKKELDDFLDEVFQSAVTDISVKTRIGKDHPDEFYELIEIYNKYPIKELIIHPRIQKDMYNNTPNLSVFREALAHSKNPVCYNGDIRSVRDYKQFAAQFPEVDTIMIGRGLVADPALAIELQGGAGLKKEQLKVFHDMVYGDYQKILSGDRNVLFKMKEIWYYLIPMFTDSAKHAKRIRKAERFAAYEEAVDSLFREQELIRPEDRESNL